MFFINLGQIIDFCKRSIFKQTVFLYVPVDTTLGGFIALCPLLQPGVSPSLFMSVCQYTLWSMWPIPMADIYSSNFGCRINCIRLLIYISRIIIKLQQCPGSSIFQQTLQKALLLWEGILTQYQSLNQMLHHSNLTFLTVVLGLLESNCSIINYLTFGGPYTLKIAIILLPGPSLIVAGQTIFLWDLKYWNGVHVWILAPLFGLITYLSF